MFQFVLLVDFQEYPCWYAPQHILYIYYIYILYPIYIYIYCYSKIPQILIDFASHGPMGPWAHGDWMGHFQPATAMGWAKARRRLCLAWPGPPVACLVIASVFGHVLQSISIMRKSNKIIQNSFIIYIYNYVLYIIYMYYNYIYYNSILTSSSASTAFHRTPAISPRRGGNPRVLRLPTGCCPPAIGRALALTGWRSIIAKCRKNSRKIQRR
jgi:hypothetical protein